MLLDTVSYEILCLEQVPERRTATDPSSTIQTVLPGVMKGQQVHSQLGVNSSICGLNTAHLLQLCTGWHKRAGLEVLIVAADVVFAETGARRFRL